VGAPRRYALRVHDRLDRAVPAGRPLHRREAGRLVEAVDQLDHHRCLAPVPAPPGQHADDDQVRLTRLRPQLRIQQRVEDVARRDTDAANLDRLGLEEPGVHVGLPGGEVAGPAQRLVPQRPQPPLERPRHRRGAAAGDEGLHPADRRREVDCLVILLAEGGHLDAAPVAEEVGDTVVLVREPGDVEGEDVVEGRLRVQRVAAVPEGDLIGLVEERHRVDAQARAHPRDLAAVGDHRDAGRLGLRGEGELLAHEVRVAAEVGHAGPRLDRGTRDRRVQPVGHGGQEGVHVVEEGPQRTRVGRIHREGLGDLAAEQGVDTGGCAPRGLEVDVGDLDAGSFAEAGHVVRGGRSLAPGADDRVGERHGIAPV